MSCLKIIVNNLSVEASARLGDVTSAYLDIPFGYSTRKSKNQEALRTTNDIETEGIIRFDLDYTPTNDALFMDFMSPLTFDRVVDWLDVTVIEDGAGLNFNRLFVVGKDESRQVWIVELARPADHWADLAPEKTIDTIEYGSFQFVSSKLAESWEKPAYEGNYSVWNEATEGSSNPAYYWPVVDYGNVVDQQPAHVIDGAPRRMICMEDLRPFVNLGYILVRGFCEIGWLLTGPILETEFSRRLWCYLLKEKYFQGSGGFNGNDVPFGYYGKFTGRRITDQTLLAAQTPILCDAVEFSFGTNGLKYLAGVHSNYLLGIKNNYPFYSKFTFSFKFEVENNNPGALKAGFVVGEVEGTNNDDFTGEFLTDFQYFDIGAGTTDLLVMEFEVTLAPGQKACLLHDSVLAGGDKILKGLWCNIEHENECISRSDFVNFQTILRNDVSLMDCFKAYLHLTQGRYTSDPVSKTLTVYSRRTAKVHSEVTQGFLKDSEVSVNLDDILVKDSIRIQYLRRDLPRYTRLQFADANDAYIEELDPEEPTHSRKITNGFDLPDETEEIENILFEPTVEGQWQESNLVRPVGRAPFPFIPRLWDNVDGYRSFDIGPRIVYAFGLVAQINPEPFDLSLQGGEHAAFLFEGYTNPTNAITEFGYATQLRTWDLDPVPAIDGSVVFGTAPFDLFSMFYLGFSQENSGGASIDLLLYMKQSFYSSVDFRDLYKFSYLGRPVTAEMIEINDFTACDDIPTQARFFVSPVTSKCCDGPCSCQYITCEYYFDFGLFMRQSTLNQLHISSFKVDDIEQLTQNIGFGDLNIVDKGGQPYVLNFVDALNSLAIPYFLFSPSLRVHPEKGMRYFKLKRPLCQNFIIEIEQVSTVVYRYTDSIQETNWFGGGFGDLGYGSAYHGTPIDCINTQEY